MAQGIKPSVCVEAVFNTLPAHEAIPFVRRAGIEAFEFWGWWDKELDSIKQAKADCELKVSACCTHFISLVDPSVRAHYLEGLKRSIEVAQSLECPTLITQVGDFLQGVPRQEQHDSLVRGLVEAAPLLENSGVTLVIEPLNDLVDHPGYYLVRSDEAFEVVKKVGSANIKVVFDIYHQQISEGHLIHNISKNIDWIGHFHAAGNPGRHELTVGEINYPQVFAAIQATQYDGYVGLEYWPMNDPLAGLEVISNWFSEV